MCILLYAQFFRYSNTTFLKHLYRIWRLQRFFICIVKPYVTKTPFFRNCADMWNTCDKRHVVTLSRPLFYICCTDSTSSSSSIFYLGQPISRILATIVLNFYCTFLCIILLTKPNKTHRYIYIIFYVLDNIKILQNYIFKNILD